jgi:PiT family inorganic phosphate transporter
MDLQVILLIVGLVLAFIMSINIGGNDAANPTSPAVGAGVLSVRKALIWFGIFTIIGAGLQGFMVMKTIGKGVVPEIDVLGAISIIVAANIWILFATVRGMAISTTHAIISGVIGYGIVRFTIYGINATVLGTIALSWVLSPLCSLALAFLIYRWFISFVARHSNNPLKIEKYMKALLIGSLAFGAYSFGSNDVANATGVYLTITSKLGNIPDFTTMFLLAILAGVGIVIGGIVIGPKVIETLAFKVTRLDLNSALSASISNALVVYLFTTLPYLLFGYGLPISTSYAAVGAILEAGLAQSSRAISKAVTLKLVGFWIITIPGSALLTIAVYLVLGSFIHL